MGDNFRISGNIPPPQVPNTSPLKAQGGLQGRKVRPLAYTSIPKNIVSQVVEEQTRANFNKKIAGTGGLIKALLKRLYPLLLRMKIIHKATLSQEEIVKTVQQQKEALEGKIFAGSYSPSGLQEALRARKDLAHLVSSEELVRIDREIATQAELYERGDRETLKSHILSLSTLEGYAVQRSDLQEEERLAQHALEQHRFQHQKQVEDRRNAIPELQRARREAKEEASRLETHKATLERRKQEREKIEKEAASPLATPLTPPSKSKKGVRSRLLGLAGKVFKPKGESPIESLKGIVSEIDQAVGGAVEKVKHVAESGYFTLKGIEDDIREIEGKQAGLKATFDETGAQIARFEKEIEEYTTQEEKLDKALKEVQGRERRLESEIEQFRTNTFRSLQHSRELAAYADGAYFWLFLHNATLPPEARRQREGLLLSIPARQVVEQGLTLVDQDQMVESFSSQHQKFLETYRARGRS